MIATPNILSAGYRELGSQSTQSLWKTIASSSGRTGSQLEMRGCPHKRTSTDREARPSDQSRRAPEPLALAGEALPRRRSTASKVVSASRQATGRYCDANVAVQKRRLCASLRVSFCNSCRKLHLSRLRPEYCDALPSLISHVPNHKLLRWDLQTRWHAHCKALRHNNADCSVRGEPRKERGKGMLS